jgi:hypothetical protein
MALTTNLDWGITFDGYSRNEAHAADINRYLGGFNRQQDSHPYVKGYFYVFFGFPERLFSTNSITKHQALVYSLSAAEGYTPPGDRQLKTEDVMGMGGVDASFITGQTIDRNFSLQYRDYWGAPIFRIHRQWTQYLNPYFGGVTDNYGGEDSPIPMFMAQEYKGTAMVIQTKPITKRRGNDYGPQDIIKVDFFDGVFPVTDLKSAYDSNITDNSIAKPTVQYRFDGFPLDETNDDVMDKALEVLTSIHYDTKNASPAIYQELIDTGADYIRRLDTIGNENPQPRQQ